MSRRFSVYWTNDLAAVLVVEALQGLRQSSTFGELRVVGMGGFGERFGGDLLPRFYAKFPMEGAFVFRHSSSDPLAAGHVSRPLPST